MLVSQVRLLVPVPPPQQNQWKIGSNDFSAHGN